MKMAISNIAWDAGEDAGVYALMRKYGYMGLEIAPTRFFAADPHGAGGVCGGRRLCGSVDAVDLVWQDGETVRG